MGRNKSQLSNYDDKASLASGMTGVSKINVSTAFMSKGDLRSQYSDLIQQYKANPP